MSEERLDRIEAQIGEWREPIVEQNTATKQDLTCHAAEYDED
ncbi:hypothetical protein [Chamaesiphon polymorphus]|nr:hypothetical protein [Chamaesiphon polymorphus]